MELNTLSPATGSTKAKKRVGRGVGSGWGKTCGTGHKGQKSRSGGTVRPGFEGGQMPLQMRLPKYGFSSRVGRITAEVRTSELNKVDGDSITIESLRKAGIITSSIKRAKIMLSGEVTKKVTVEGIGVTKGAKAAIEKAGGKVVEVEATAPAKLVKKAKAEAAPAEKKAAAKKPAKKKEAKVEEAPAEDAPASDEEAGEE
jgi:large subunit ribosomal protein L15